MTQEVVERLDRIISILQLAFREPIEEARNRIREDSLSKALLDAAADEWIPGGELVRSVVASSSGSARSVSRRLSALVSLGAIDKQGGGAQTRYRSSGLI